MGNRVETAAGAVGGMEKDGLLQFRGIPFAAAPVGPLRFLPPQPHPGWAGVRDCTRYGPTALQAGGGIEQLLGSGSIPAGEDCLYLNVVTPSLTGSRPVLVWIHGGSFVTGSGSVPWYNGARLARAGDVVVVTLNYRLGSLGFLHLAPLLGPTYAGAANAGLLDQVAALRWVQENIAAFGGDPDRVTVFGESAGAMSVSTLLGTPAAEGLFARAIAQSGAAHHVHLPDAAERVTRLLLAELGLGPGDAKKLIELPAEALMAAQNAVVVNAMAAGAAGDVSATLPFLPAVDGDTLPRPPLEAVRDGAASGVPFLTGTTSDEWNLFHLLALAQGRLTEEELLWRCERIFGPALGEGAGREALTVYRRSRPGATPDELWCALQTDRLFRIPAIRLAEAQSAVQPATFMYLFTWCTSAFGGALRSCHALDIPFVFDNLDRPGVASLLGAPGEAERRLARTMSAAWLAFARAGAPSSDEGGAWPPYDAARRATLELGGQSRVLEDPCGDERRLWDGVL